MFSLDASICIDLRTNTAEGEEHLMRTGRQKDRFYICIQGQLHSFEQKSYLMDEALKDMVQYGSEN